MGKRLGNKTTPWSEPKERLIRGEIRRVQTRYFNGREQIKVLDEDLKRERNDALDTQIPYKQARKIFKKESKNPELDKLHTAKRTYLRPNRRWANDVSHYDVKQIDAP